jgi:hypothetical protein
VSNPVYIASTDNQVNLVNTDKHILISQPTCDTAIEVVQPVTSVVEILTGPPGPAGADGRNAFPYTGNAVISGSLTVTGSIYLLGGSYSGSGANLYNIPASAVVGLSMNQISTGSITASVNLLDDLFLIKSASVDLFKVTKEAVVVLKPNLAPPTPVTGGIFYSASGDFFFGS